MHKEYMSLHSKRRSLLLDFKLPSNENKTDLLRKFPVYFIQKLLSPAENLRVCVMNANNSCTWDRLLVDKLIKTIYFNTKDDKQNNTNSDKYSL